MPSESKTENPSLFVSWSKEGKAIANQFKIWIEDVLSTISVFCSDQDIEKGERSVNVIFSQLDNCSIGVIVITPNTAYSQWIHFEAGALFKGPQSRVMPLLVGMGTSQLEGPLNQLQATEAGNKDAMFALVRAINSLTTEIESERLNRQFERLWPEWLSFAGSLRIDHGSRVQTGPDPVEIRLDRILQSLDKINSYLFASDDGDEFDVPFSRKRAVPKITGAHLLGLEPGDDVAHSRYGDGVVIGVGGIGDSQSAEVLFESAGTKKFMLAFTPLKRVPPGLPRLTEEDF